MSGYLFFTPLFLCMIRGVSKNTNAMEMDHCWCVSGNNLLCLSRFEAEMTSEFSAICCCIYGIRMAAFCGLIVAILAAIFPLHSVIFWVNITCWLHPYLILLLFGICVGLNANYVSSACFLFNEFGHVLLLIFSLLHGTHWSKNGESHSETHHELFQLKTRIYVHPHSRLRTPKTK